MKLTLVSSKYNYYITYKGTLSPRCEYPRERVIQRIRTNRVNYINHENKIVKYITYPEELCSFVLPDDIVENEIIQIKNHYPDWTKIEILTRPCSVP
jgi:hypothetical protein